MTVGLAIANLQLFNFQVPHHVPAALISQSMEIPVAGVACRRRLTSNPAISWEKTRADPPENIWMTGDAAVETMDMATFASTKANGALCLEY